MDGKEGSMRYGHLPTGASGTLDGSGHERYNRWLVARQHPRLAHHPGVHHDPFRQP